MTAVGAFSNVGDEAEADAALLAASRPERELVAPDVAASSA